MEVEEILTQVRSNSAVPANWVIFHLIRSKVTWGIAGWVFGILLGFGLFILVSLIVIPTNYQHGIISAILTTLILGIFLFIGIGSSWSFIVDIRRLQLADQHLIVITPDAFIKQEGKKIIHVPLTYVRHVTIRGVPETNDTTLSKVARNETREEVEVPRASENITGFLLGRGTTSSGARWRLKRARTPMSLAFIDIRSNKEVLVVEDGVYGDPFTIAALLKDYTMQAQQLM